MDPALPAVPILYNYDTDRDASPGLLILKGGSGPNEPDSTRHQHWVTPVFPAAVTLQGDAIVKLWSAMKDFHAGKGGVVTVYLRECEGWDCVELGSGTVDDPNWQGGNPDWALKTATVSVGTYTLPPGHNLELELVVDGSSDDDMWFAYDTGPYRSRVIMSASSDASPLAGSGGVLPGLLARWIAQPWARWLFT